MSKALAHVTRGDWPAAIVAAEGALQAIGAARSEPRARSRDELVELAHLRALADWAAARAEHGLGAETAALERLAKPTEDELEARPGTASLAWSLRAEILVDLGLPDLAKEPFRRAMALCDRDAASVLEKRNFGAFFDAYCGDARRLLALGRTDAVLERLEEAESKVDWAQVAAKMQDARTQARRAKIELLRGIALAQADASGAPRRDEARAALQRAAAYELADPLDRFSARARLAQISIDARDFERADAELREVDDARAQPNAAALPLEEEAWLAALRTRLARLRGHDVAPHVARLEALFQRMLGDWGSVQRTGGVGFLWFVRARSMLVELVLSAPAERWLSIAVEAGQFGTLWHGLGAPRPSAADVRATLCGKDTGILWFVAADDAGVLLAIDGEHVQRHEIPGTRWLQARAQELESASAGRAKGSEVAEATDAAALRARIARELLPVRAREVVVRWKHVRVVGRELLAGIAPQGLIVFDDAPLAVTHATSELPSLPVGWALKHRRGAAPSASGRIVLVAAPEPAAALRQRFRVLDRSPLTRADVEPLCASLAARDPVVLLGADATLGALRDAAASAAVLHVLAHGVFDAERELRSMIVLTPDALAPDGLFTVERARALRVPDLVVLSSCRAADGVHRFGDAASSHLGGAMLLAGASSVVVSEDDLWLRDALRIGAAFHAERDAGASVAEALRRASAPLASARPDWNAPFVLGLGE